MPGELVLRGREAVLPATALQAFALMAQPSTPPAGDRAPVRPADSAPLGIDAREFQRLGHLLVDSVAGFLQSVPQQETTAAELPDETVRTFLDARRRLPS